MEYGKVIGKVVVKKFVKFVSKDIISIAIIHVNLYLKDVLKPMLMEHAKYVIQDIN